MARDRLSKLSNSLLCSHILTRLSLKNAIQCSLLSRRWIYLWRQLPCLSFSEEFFENLPQRCIRRKNQIEKIIDNVLQMHSAPLEVFEFNNNGWCKNGKIQQWIVLAELKGVKKISLETSCMRGAYEEVPASLFHCTRLINLFLNKLELKNMPSDFGGFAILETCCLFGVKMNDEILESLVRSCPTFETLTLKNCIGLRDLKICSPNLKSMSITILLWSNESMTGSVAADCPRLVKIKIEGYNFEKMELHCPVYRTLITGVPLEMFTNMKSLKKIILCGGSCDVNILNNFPLIQQLCVYNRCFYQQDMENIALQLPQLETVHVDISQENISFLTHLLKSSPGLKKMIVAVGKNRYYNITTQVIKKLVTLIRLDVRERIFVSKYGCGLDCMLSDI